MNLVILSPPNQVRNWNPGHQAKIIKKSSCGLSVSLGSFLNPYSTNEGTTDKPTTKHLWTPPPAEVGVFVRRGHLGPGRAHGAEAERSHAGAHERSGKRSRVVGMWMVRGKWGDLRGWRSGKRQKHWEVFAFFSRKELNPKAIKHPNTVWKSFLWASAFSRRSAGRTSLIVAHRLATVQRCDTVAFLEAKAAKLSLGGSEGVLEAPVETFLNRCLKHSFGFNMFQPVSCFFFFFFLGGGWVLGSDGVSVVCIFLVAFWCFWFLFSRVFICWGLDLQLQCFFINKSGQCNVLTNWNL